MRKLPVAVCFVLGSMILAQAADAHGWCNTRNKCRWWAKKYTANTSVGCWGFSIPLCYQHSGSCGTASANCGWKSCIVGGASASASNSSSGCFVSTSHSGLGHAGVIPPDSATNSEDAGGGQVQSFADFDDATQTVTITIASGELSAASGGMPARLSAFIFVEDVREGEVVEDPVRTPENTVWEGSIVLDDGAATVAGFDPDAVTVITDRNGASIASISGTRAVVPLRLSAEDFENLVVQIVSDEIALPK